MKKFIAIVLVLAIAPLASASLVSFADNGQTINAGIGEIVTIAVVTDTGLYGLNVAAEVSGDGVLVGAGTDAAWDLALSFDPIVTPAQAIIGYGIFGAALTGEVAYFEVLSTGGYWVLELVADYTLGGTCDIYFEEPTIHGTVTIVPEPMTMALLGLGGLFIRRRA